MGHFYFARHGQTVWNVENKICGATDIELTELGHQQAEELGQAILEQGIQIDEILYSPLIRAKETARHVSEVTGIPMREEMRLKEQNFGKYEGTPDLIVQAAAADNPLENTKVRREMERNSRRLRLILLILMKAANRC